MQGHSDLAEENKSELNHLSKSSQIWQVVLYIVFKICFELICKTKQNQLWNEVIWPMRFAHVFRKAVI